jgi:hypothetical protein
VSIDVFRAAVLSIVLTLVAGPNASLLCAVWCHPEAATAGPCEEHPDPTSTPSITGNDSCPDIVASSTAVVREDVRREVSAAAQQAVLVARLQFAPPPRHSASARESGQRSTLDVRPLAVALRI